MRQAAFHILAAPALNTFGAVARIIFAFRNSTLSLLMRRSCATTLLYPLNSTSAGEVCGSTSSFSCRSMWICWFLLLLCQSFRLPPFLLELVPVWAARLQGMFGFPLLPFQAAHFIPQALVLSPQLMRSATSVSTRFSRRAMHSRARSSAMVLRSDSAKKGSCTGPLPSLLFSPRIHNYRNRIPGECQKSFSCA